MKITIYQIIPELDQDRLMFMPLSYFQKAGYPSPPAEIYESVFCGETEVATLEEIYRIFNRKDEADARYLEKIGFTGHSMSVSDIWKYRTHREKAASISVIRLAFLKYHFRKKAPCCPSRIMIISLMSRSAGPSPVIWPIWITAEFLFIPVSRFSSNAANTVSANSATGSVTGRRKGYLRGRENFWNVLLSFCSRIRKGRLRKIYGITALNLRFGSPAPNTQPAKPESGGRMVPEPKCNL